MLGGLRKVMFLLTLGSLMASCATQMFTFHDKNTGDNVMEVFVIGGIDITKQVVDISNICGRASKVLSVSFMKMFPHKQIMRRSETYNVAFKKVDNGFGFLRLMSVSCLN